jgi:hypothetical protein
MAVLSRIVIGEADGLRINKISATVPRGRLEGQKNPNNRACPVKFRMTI